MIDLYVGGETIVLLAHGAGTDRKHPHITDLAEALSACGVSVATFDYPYRAEGRKPPDRSPVLLECHRSIANHLRSRGDVVLAGRSMGGRMATMLAAEGFETPAAIAYGYPLHPAGRPEKLRVEHLEAISVPVLFVRGSRDSLARADLFDAHIRGLPYATVVDIEGADHSFRHREMSPKQMAEVLADATAVWLLG